MQYTSTSGLFHADIKKAFSECFATDGSLYLPDRILPIPKALFNNIEEMTVSEIAYVVASQILGHKVERSTIKNIADATFKYNIPFIPIDSSTEAMELFHGPTMAFKDFSAKFAAGLYKLSDSRDRPLVGLVATTGNTGAAIANAFDSVPGMHTFVLFPQGALSRSQLAQFTTLGSRVHAVEVAGDIAKCKELVRQAMADESLREFMNPACLNTANFIRIIPQVALFFYAYAHVKATRGNAQNMAVAVPCGNLSSLVSAVIAKKLGLPLGTVVAGCTANDDLVRVLSGQIAPEKVNHSSRRTMARAMDSGFPTNLERLVSLYNGNIALAARDIMAFSVDDNEIADTIIRVSADSGYLPDPHTAVAFAALAKASLPPQIPRVVFATAHPAKSLDIMTAITGRTVDLPLQMTRFMSRGAMPKKLPPTYTALRKFLLSQIN